MSNLDSVIKDINKKLKLGNIQLGVEYQDLERIPFSSCRLNYMTYGGIPVGRITEFSGAEYSGKTTTALDVAKQAQKLYPDRKVLICDIEHTFDTVWATKLGVDIDNILYFDPDALGAEEVFNTLLKLIDSKEISLVILDSIGNMVSNQANEKEIGEKTYGGISMSLTEFSKKVTPILARTKTALIGINQIREDMNSMYGGTITTGGRNWKHSCSMRLEFRQGNFLDNKGNKLPRNCENPAGNLVNVALIKSKVCRPDRKTGFYTLNYLDGIDFVSDAFDVAVKLGIINQSAAWYNLVDIESGEILTDENNEALKFQGKSKCLDYLREHEDVYDKMLEDIDKLQSE